MNELFDKEYAEAAPDCDVVVCMGMGKTGIPMRMGIKSAMGWE